MLRSLTLSAIDELDEGAIPSCSTIDTCYALQYGLAKRVNVRMNRANITSIACIFDGAELGSTGVIKTVPRPKAKTINANDNFVVEARLAA